MPGTAVPVSVIVTLAPGADSKAVRQQIQNAIRQAVAPIPGVQSVSLSPVVN